MTPETRYAKGDHGLVAYQVLGNGPIDLVPMTASVSHVDAAWDLPVVARSYQRYARFSRLITFDRRGIGASDPVPFDAVPTMEEWADDLRLVLDAAGSERAAIIATLEAGPVAIMFAATYPNRTAALVLANTSARWLAADDYPEGLARETAEGYLEFREAIWGTEEGAALATPSLASDERFLGLFAKYMRAAASPRVFGALQRPPLESDLRSVLPAIRVPTLVMHSRQLPYMPIEQGRYLADHILGAKFVELPGGDGGIHTDETGFAIDTIEEFLTGVKPAAEPDRALATVLFTDMVDSTRIAAEMGDRKWRQLLDRHDEIARSHVEQFRGQVKKSTGDGILATFDAPGRAIRCTMALRDALKDLGLPTRAGLHAGEVELRGDDIGGIAVHTASRVAATAGAGEVVVSRTVTDLVAGSGFRFTDRGLHSLKGVPGEWQLFTVEQ